MGGILWSVTAPLKIFKPQRHKRVAIHSKPYAAELHLQFKAVRPGSLLCSLCAPFMFLHTPSCSSLCFCLVLLLNKHIKIYHIQWKGAGMDQLWTCYQFTFPELVIANYNSYKWNQEDMSLKAENHNSACKGWYNQGDSCGVQIKRNKCLYLSYLIQSKNRWERKHFVHSISQVFSSTLLWAFLHCSSAHWLSDNPLFVAGE